MTERLSRLLRAELENNLYNHEIMENALDILRKLPRRQRRPRWPRNWQIGKGNSVSIRSFIAPSK
jgi:hypothetical protein